jgi:hypothetical protein
MEPNILKAMRNVLAAITAKSLEGWNDDVISMLCIVSHSLRIFG